MRYYSYPHKAEPLRFEMGLVARRFAIFVIIISSVLIFGNIAANAYFDPKAVAERELESLAKDYYENYFYDNFVAELRAGYAAGREIVYENKEQQLGDENTDAEIESFEDYMNEGFFQYVKNGLPTVYLRKLLLFDDGRHTTSRQYFSNQYVCNTNHTAVKIKPYPPFGRTDYETEYIYECEWASGVVK